MAEVIGESKRSLPSTLSFTAYRLGLGSARHALMRRTFAKRHELGGWIFYLSSIPPLEGRKNVDPTSLHPTSAFAKMEKFATPPAAKPFRPQSVQDWDDRRAIIEQLYWAEDRELPKVSDIMETRHNFSATYCSPHSARKIWWLTGLQAEAVQDPVQALENREECQNPRDEGDDPYTEEAAGR